MQVTLRFYPNQRNPARASGRGVYRVVNCTEARHFTAPICVVDYKQPKLIPPRLIMHADRYFKSNSRVDPVKIALAARGLS